MINDRLQNSEIANQPTGPLVSVVIPTHNRCHLLAKGIKSLLRQDFPSADYEIIVVDNGSTDNTRDCVERFVASGEVLVRYHYEPRLGLSHARNAGLEIARGLYVGFLDDDLEVSPAWVKTLYESFTLVDPTPGIVCGPVCPAWEREPPRWLVYEFQGYHSMLDFSPEPTCIPEWGWFPEGNSAFRLDLLKSIGGFPTKMGRKGDSLLSGEGIDVQQKIRSMGLPIYYHPHMRVDHFVPAERLSLWWLVRRAYYQGVTNVVHYLDGKNFGILSRIKYSCLYFFWSLPSFLSVASSGVMNMLSGFDNQRMIVYVRSLLELAKKWGWLCGFARQSSRYGNS